MEPIFHVDTSKVRQASEYLVLPPFGCHDRAALNCGPQAPCNTDFRKRREDCELIVPFDWKASEDYVRFIVAMNDCRRRG